MSSTKKKVGIITLVKVGNYGAELQAFALQRALNTMGFDAEIIDYPYFTNPRHKVVKESRPSFELSYKSRFIHILFPLYSHLKKFLCNLRVLRVRKDRFDSFHKKNTRFSIEYRSIIDLFSANMDYDIYVVGSDQVWNPNNYTSLDPYFLKFAPKEARKISYASSFGVSFLPEESKDYFSCALKGLDAVSVREENAVRLVEEVSGIKAECVLDPSFLLSKDDWNQIAHHINGIPDKYVLLYEVTPCPYLYSLAAFIARQNDFKIVKIERDASYSWRKGDYVSIKDAGPAEFVWAFAHASFVVTNSFHGIAFSLIMNKDFFVVTPRRKQNNSRQVSLLNRFGLENRLIVENASLENINGIKSINYSLVSRIMEEQKVKSINFLNTSMNGE